MACIKFFIVVLFVNLFCATYLFADFFYYPAYYTIKTVTPERKVIPNASAIFSYKKNFDISGKATPKYYRKKLEFSKKGKAFWMGFVRSTPSLSDIKADGFYTRYEAFSLDKNREIVLLPIKDPQPMYQARQRITLPTDWSGVLGFNFATNELHVPYFYGQGEEVLELTYRYAADVKKCKIDSPRGPRRNYRPDMLIFVSPNYQVTFLLSNSQLSKFNNYNSRFLGPYHAPKTGYLMQKIEFTKDDYYKYHKNRWIFQRTGTTNNYGIFYNLSVGVFRKEIEIEFDYIYNPKPNTNLEIGKSMRLNEKVNRYLYYETIDPSEMLRKYYENPNIKQNIPENLKQYIKLDVIVLKKKYFAKFLDKRLYDIGKKLENLLEEYRAVYIRNGKYVPNNVPAIVILGNKHREKLNKIHQLEKNGKWSKTPSYNFYSNEEWLMIITPKGVYLPYAKNIFPTTVPKIYHVSTKSYELYLLKNYFARDVPKKLTKIFSELENFKFPQEDNRYFYGGNCSYSTANYEDYKAAALKEYQALTANKKLTGSWKFAKAPYGDKSSKIMFFEHNLRQYQGIYGMAPEADGYSITVYPKGFFPPHHRNYRKTLFQEKVYKCGYWNDIWVKNSYGFNVSVQYGVNVEENTIAKLLKIARETNFKL